MNWANVFVFLALVSFVALFLSAVALTGKKYTGISEDEVNRIATGATVALFGLIIFGSLAVGLS